MSAPSTGGPGAGRGARPSDRGERENRPGSPPPARRGEQAALAGLARCPFMSAPDLALLLGAAPVTAYRHLGRLAAAGLVEWVPYVSTRYRHERLWYLAESGVRAAAALAGADPAAFAAEWGLGEATLLRRLCRLEHLVLSRGFLLDLAASLAERAAGPRLARWQPWPVRLTYPWRRRHHASTLDGAATLVWADATSAHTGGAGASSLEAGGRTEVLLLWDDGGGLALSALRPRLVALARARLAAQYATAAALATAPALGTEDRQRAIRAAFPVVLVVATRPSRAEGAWRLVREVAHAQEARAAAVLVTSADALREAGPLDALWRDETGQDGPLPVLLALRTVPLDPRSPAGQVAERTAPAALPGVPDPSGRRLATPGPLRTRPLVRGGFARRAALPRAGGPSPVTVLVAGAGGPRGEPGVDGARRAARQGETARGAARPCALRGRALALLALRPAQLRVLQCLGIAPLATLGTLAELTGEPLAPRRDTGHAWRPPQTVRRLLQAGLIGEDPPTGVQAQASCRYFLTSGGLALLATRAGLTPATYRRLSGSIAGERVPLPRVLHTRREQPVSVPGDRPRGPRRSCPLVPAARRGGQLAYYRRFLEHTVAVQDVLVAFVRAARAAAARGQDEALETWLGEWAALRYYPQDGAWHALRPDAYGRYRRGGQVLAFYLELDRESSGLSAVAAKLRAYGAYRESGLWAHDWEHAALVFPHLLIITGGEGRVRHVLELARARAAPLVPPLVVWAATARDVAVHGPLGSIWRSQSTQPPHLLFPPQGQAT